jgi:uncharacterized protein (DUF1786 family)
VATDRRVMQILTIDVGTGTQDIFLLRAGLGLETGLKLVMPSPTMVVWRQIRAATRRRLDVLLTGKTMGGGPSHWAARDHLRSGLRLFATPDAARSFNDDLDQVQREMGVVIVSEDEAAGLHEVERLCLRDLDYPAIEAAFLAFGVDPSPDALAVAVFDHGAAPPGVSDREFRFDYLLGRIRSSNRLSAFAYRAEEIPASLTRMKAVAETAAELGCPLVVMDTAPAAVLGATLDPAVAAAERVLVANVGNFHTLAFRLGPGGIEGLFEHHTGMVDRGRLEALLSALAEGTLTHAEVYDEGGHGAILLRTDPLSVREGEFGVVVTGPRRARLRSSWLRPYFAVPFGDMMIAGCFGLLAAAADLLPDLSGPIREALAGAGADRPPWEVEG